MQKLTTLMLSVLFCGATQLQALDVGDAVPEFSAPDDSGSTWSSADHVGKKVLVVYFYPADMTGGCTKQACSYRDHSDAFEEKGIQVIGISGDSVQNHQHFKKVYNLNFPLLADEDGSVAKAFGVPTRAGGTITRTIDGEEVELTRGVSAGRWTFVIGKDGKVLYKNESVNPAKDAETILALDALK